MVYGVPFTVLGYLILPEIRHFFFPCWESVSVPEIAVHKDHDPSLAEDDIRLAGQILDVFVFPATNY